MTRAEAARTAPPVAMRRLGIVSRHRIRTIVVFVLFLAAWESIVRVFEVPRFLVPAPSEVAQALGRGLFVSPDARNGLWLHAGYTLLSAMIGLAIGSTCGILLGILISHSPTVESVLKPYIVALQSTPKVALAPLIVIWFGFGIESKIVVVALLTFFPLLVNSYAGFQSVDRDRIDLLRSVRASRWQIFHIVELPSALPYIFAGMEMAVVYALIGAIVAEFVGGRDGLGVLIMQMNYQLNIAGTFSVFVVLAVLGITLSALLGALRRRVLFWMPAQRDNRTLSA
jgi:NitT/TauT family transport system permease protein